MLIDKPLAMLDLETTGINIQQDRIVSIAVIKKLPDGSKETKSVLINPGIPIPPQASEVHGITDEMVQDKPMFKHIAKSLLDFLFGCDLGGYNSDHFDIPMLIQEFHRCGIQFPQWEMNQVDSLKIERILNSHKLEHTFQRWTGKPMENAHDALADITATDKVLDLQIERLAKIMADDPDWNEKEINPRNIDQYCQGDKKRFDVAGKTYQSDGTVFWSFGKNMNQPVLEDRSYLNWVLNSDFPIETKEKLKTLIIEKQK